MATMTHAFSTQGSLQMPRPSIHIRKLFRVQQPQHNLLSSPQHSEAYKDAQPPAPKPYKEEKPLALKDAKYRGLEQAAQAISFSPSLLRSYTRVYEAIGGRLARNDNGLEVYSQELLLAFSYVLEQVRQGEAIQSAMQQILENETKQKKQDIKTKKLDREVKQKLDSLSHANSQLEKELLSLREEISALKARRKHLA